MKSAKLDVKSVAVIGAGAAGAITVSALQAENYFQRIRVFERRESAGGTWIHDQDPGLPRAMHPGKLPTEIDRPLQIPNDLPQVTAPCSQERWALTPIYDTLTTNVPDIAMSFSDSKFPYGPFVPHYVARQYIENYFAIHETDNLLELNTTVEDLSSVPSGSRDPATWKLTLRKYDPTRHVDIWWEEFFDAVVLANGHYSVPYVPQVEGLEEYITKYPGRVSHSKFYRSPLVYESKRVIVVGNSASGHDVSTDLVSAAQHPVYVSRRSKSKWDGDEPPVGVSWKPTIREYKQDGRVIFSDGTHLDNIDAIIYCTGYKASFPFWNEKNNKAPLWDYKRDRLVGSYQHTFFRDFPNLGIVGLPRTLTFRSFEYQAIALARLWSNRNSVALPPRGIQESWETEQDRKTRSRRSKFHDIPWENGETTEYLEYLFKIAGLGTIHGEGRIPPVLGKEMVWAIENIHKYPEPPAHEKNGAGEEQDVGESWLMVPERRNGLFGFL